jgi:uncharacterized protein YceH (UPF0502 family)
MDGSSPQPPPLLTLVEARVLASLIEKELTTPDAYPLTLNATVNASNQKSNRNPVMSLTEQDVELALEGLRRKGLVVHFTGAESRVPKFKQSLDGIHPVGLAERVVLCELMLRGPQTPGELRGHCNRMHPFPDTEAVNKVIQDLMDAPGEPLIKKLERQPGQKEQRYLQLLSEQTEIPVPTDAGPAQPIKVALSLPPEVEERIHALEETCAALRTEVAELKELLMNL